MDGQDRCPRHLVTVAPLPSSADPAASDAYRGRVLDLDGHIMFGPDIFADLLGESQAGPILEWLEPMFRGMSAELRASGRERALADIGAVRGFLALGADDPADRLRALDLLGFDRQLILPPVAWPTLDTPGPDGLAGRRRYSDYIGEWAGQSKRLVAAGLLALHDPLEARREAERLAARGLRAVEVPFAAPPGGVSPADERWDPVWSVLAEAGIAVVLHLGGAGAGTAVPAHRDFIDRGWTRIDHLRTNVFPERMRTLSENANAGPVALATLHIPAEVFLTSLLLGGALDRHRGLRVVVLEMGAQWVSSWVERLDAVADTYAMFGLRPLERKPSEAIRRQVRIAPFERNDVATWIENDGLDDVYVFASDYPHAEGGRDPMARLTRTLDRLGPEVLQKFFVDNAASILGDCASCERAS